MDSFFGRDIRPVSINLRVFTVDTDSTIEMLPKSSKAKTLWCWSSSSRVDLVTHATSHPESNVVGLVYPGSKS